MLIVTEPVSTDTPLVRKIQEISSILNPLTGPWVAGGAARRVYLGEDLGQGDIDIFVNFEHYNETREKLFERPNGLIPSSVRARTEGHDVYHCRFKSDGAASVQLICVKKTVRTLTDLFATFDFTTCCFATDGYVTHRMVGAEKAATERSLCLVAGAQKRKTPRRILKYARYGYTPEPGLLREVVGDTFNVSSSLTIGTVDRDY